MHLNLPQRHRAKTNGTTFLTIPLKIKYVRKTGKSRANAPTMLINATTGGPKFGQVSSMLISAPLYVAPLSTVEMANNIIGPSVSHPTKPDTKSAAAGKK